MIAALGQRRAARAVLALICLPFLTVGAAEPPPDRDADTAGDEAYITNQNGDDVSVVDLRQRRVVATIAVGGKPAGIAMARDGRRAYVSSTNGKYLTAIDTATRTVVGRLGLPDECVGLALVGDETLYAVGFFGGRIFKIDARTMRLQASAALGGTPSGIVAAPDGRTLLVTKRDADELAIIDGDTLAVAAIIAVGHRPYGVTVDRDGLRAYTANVYSDDVSVIDLPQRKLVGNVKVGRRPYVVALAGGKAFVSDQYDGRVSVFDPLTLAPLGTIPVGDYPDGIQGTPDGRRVYAVNWESNTLSEIDVASQSVVATIAVGDSPRAFGTFLRRAP